MSGHTPARKRAPMLGKWPFPNKLSESPAKARGLWIRRVLVRAQEGQLESYGDWDLRDQLRTLHVPTLVVHGTEDVFPMDIAQEWTAALPRAKLVQMPAAGHFPFAERPELFWPVIEKFLAASED